MKIELEGLRDCVVEDLLDEGYDPSNEETEAHASIENCLSGTGRVISVLSSMLDELDWDDIEYRLKELQEYRLKELHCNIG